MTILCVIPARLGSTRLHEKVLRPISGKPLIQHTYECAKAAACFEDVLVACDDARVEEAVRAFGGRAVRTAATHQSGTSRIAEVMRTRNADVVVNLQADEPLTHPDMFSELVEGMRASSAPVGTLARRETDPVMWRDPNVVKVVLDHEGRALYFSRSAIPYGRERPPDSFLKHLGIYAYRRDVLLGFDRLKSSAEEKIEMLEQLRFLSNGIKIHVWITTHESVGVDTQAGVERLEKVLKKT